MALGSIGLQTQIWNNEIKSWFLLISYPFLLLFMLWVFFAGLALFESQSYPYATALSPAAAGWDGVTHYGHIIFAAVAAWFAIAFFFNQQMIDRATGARSVERTEAPRLYNLLENLCISRGLPMPKLRIIDTDAMNAYASGLSNRSYSVTVTRGLMDALNDQELEAVLAHELSHIRHHDVRLLVISVIFVGMISFLCQLVFRSLRYGRGIRMSRDNRRGNGAAMLVALVVLLIGYLFSVLIRFALSRRREYMADAGSVELTKNPDALITALQKISGRDKVPGTTDDVKQMFIENSSPFMGVFATHPSIDNRIAALVSMGGRVTESTTHGPWG